LDANCFFFLSAAKVACPAKLLELCVQSAMLRAKLPDTSCQLNRQGLEEKFLGDAFKGGQ